MSKHYLLFILFVFLFCISAPYAKADTVDSPSVSLSEEEKASFLKSIHFEVLEGAHSNDGIRSFDISEDGTVALAVGNSDIYVYDPSGNFQYGFRLKPQGVFGIEFLDSFLTIVFARGDQIIFIDQSGVCADVRKASNTNAHHNKVAKILNRTTKEISKGSYQLERDIGFGNSYSTLVAIDGQGNRTVLHDFTTPHLTKQIITIISIGSFLVFHLRLMYVQRKNTD